MIGWVIVRYLGLDLGGRRVGVAISDNGGRIASALTTLDGRDIDGLVARIRDLVVEHGVETIVIGQPKNVNGTLGETAAKYAKISELVAARCQIPVVYQDERYTTVEAIKTMVGLGASRKNREHKVDRVAAVLILQTYLDKLSSESRRNEFPPEWG